MVRIELEVKKRTDGQNTHKLAGSVPLIVFLHI